MRASSGTITAFLAVVIGIMPSLVWAAGSIVGTWRLVSLTREETESKKVSNPYGENPIGLMTDTPDGRMMFIVTDSRPAPPQPTDAEAAQLWRRMVTYANTYSTDGNKLTVHREVTWNQVWNGSEETASFEINDDHIQLKSAPFVPPHIGRQIGASLIWERVK